nr:hypothetical protein Iba_chr14bCG11220 [Ipomoea batatas]
MQIILLYGIDDRQTTSTVDGGASSSAPLSRLVGSGSCDGIASSPASSDIMSECEESTSALFSNRNSNYNVCGAAVQVGGTVGEAVVQVGCFQDASYEALTIKLLHPRPWGEISSQMK